MQADKHLQVHRHKEVHLIRPEVNAAIEFCVSDNPELVPKCCLHLCCLKTRPLSDLRGPASHTSQHHAPTSITWLHFGLEMVVYCLAQIPE